MRTTFTLYKYEYLIKTDLMYVEELPDEKTYKIVLEGKNIDELLEAMYLPERLKIQFQNDLVSIIKGYKMLTTGMSYTDANRELCKEYFRAMFNKFCSIYGSTYKFKEDQI